MSYQSQQTGGSGLGWIAGLIIAGILLLGMCGKNETASSDDNLVTADSGSLVVNEAAPTAEPPAPLDMSAVKRGNGQWRIVAKTQLADSSEIYSRNCYEALGRAFDWHQLDRCGGFDALAARWVDEIESSTEAELSYFQSETTASRYLAAATSHGLPPDQADVRWAKLQAAAKAAKLPAAPVSTITSAETLNDSLPSLDETGQVEQAADNEMDSDLRPSSE